MSSTLVYVLDAKLALLDEILRRYGRVAVAFSGGVDSTALLHACVRVLGRQNVLAVTADSASLPAHEREEAVALAMRIGAEHRMVASAELDNPQYRRNDGERCYFCKKELFSLMEKIAREREIPVLVYGAIADDLLDHRPGVRAAREFRVAAPLQEAGFEKEEIREYSRRYELPTASKSSFACLASRVPRGTQVDAQTLERIERAERVLRDLGYRQYRVRHYGDLAKIEVAPQETADLVFRDALTVKKSLEPLGYCRVGVDLRGYRLPGAASLVEIQSPFWTTSTWQDGERMRAFGELSMHEKSILETSLRRGEHPAESLSLLL